MKQNLKYTISDQSGSNHALRVLIDDGERMWLETVSDRYQINYCPLTGTPAPVQMEPEWRPDEKRYKNKR